MKKLFYLQIFFFFLFSCKNSTNTNRIDIKEQIEIFQNKYVSNPDTSLQIGNNKLLFIKHEDVKESIFDDIHKIIILEKIGNDWGVIKDTVISRGDRYSLSSFEFVIVDEKEFLYYEEFHPGGSMGNSDVEFTLFDLNSNAKYYIRYTKEPRGGTIWIDFKRSRNLIAYKNLSGYLDEKIKNSNIIYKPDKLEILVKRFKIENEKELINLEKPYFLEKPIKFKLISTKEEIFDIKDTTLIKKPAGIQNNDFIIISKFRGPVLGYNKTTKDYFCIWAPNQYDWVVNMQFDLTGYLILYDRHDNLPSYFINLYNSTYIRLK